MAEPLRNEYAGATYHVMGRGNQGQKICSDEHDRELGLATLVQASKRAGWLLHAWALMGNHCHLLLAWCLYGQTTVNRRWGAERLAMDYETGVSQAVRLVESSRRGAMQVMKEKLNRCGG